MFLEFVWEKRKYTEERERTKREKEERHREREREISADSEYLPISVKREICNDEELEYWGFLINPICLMHLMQDFPRYK